MRKISIISLILFTFLLVLMLSSCGAKSESGTNPVTNTARATPKPLTNSDKHLQITIPGNWNSADINSEAQIQATDPDRKMGVTVFSQPKTDLKAAGIELVSYSEENKNSLRDPLKDAKVTGPTNQTIAGNTIIQYQIEGELQKPLLNLGKERITYIYTAIESATNYNQVIVWSATSQFETNKDNLQKIITSLQELPVKSQ